MSASTHPLASTGLDDAELGDSNLANLVVAAIERASDPLSANQIDRSLGGKSRRKQIEDLLPSLLEQGKLFACGDYRGAPTFWQANVETYARQLIPRLLETRSQTKSELLAAIKSRLRGVSEKRRKEIIDELVSVGQLQLHPPLLGSRTKRLGVGSPNAAEYLQDAVEKLAKKLEQDPQAILAMALRLAQPKTPQPTQTATKAAKESGEEGVSAPTEAAESDSKSDAQLRQAILEGLPHIDPRASQGAMIGVEQIWQQVKIQFPARDQFERVMWELIRGQKLAATKHGSAGNVAEAERQTFLHD